MSGGGQTEGPVNTAGACWCRLMPPCGVVGQGGPRPAQAADVQKGPQRLRLPGPLGQGAACCWRKGSQLCCTRERAGARGLGRRRPGLEAVGRCRGLAGAAWALRGPQPLGSAGLLLCVWLLFTWWKEAGYLNAKCHKKYMFFSNAKRLLNISRVVFDFFVSYENGGFM